MAELSALRLVVRRALLKRRTKDALLDTFGCSISLPCPRAAVPSMAMRVFPGFASARALDGDSSLARVLGDSNLALALGESNLPRVPGVGKLLKSGS